MFLRSWESDNVPRGRLPPTRGQVARRGLEHANSPFGVRELDLLQPPRGRDAMRPTCKIAAGIRIGTHTQSRTDHSNPPAALQYHRGLPPPRCRARPHRA